MFENLKFVLVDVPWNKHESKKTDAFKELQEAEKEINVLHFINKDKTNYIAELKEELNKKSKVNRELGVLAEEALAIKHAFYHGYQIINITELSEVIVGNELECYDAVQNYREYLQRLKEKGYENS